MLESFENEQLNSFLPKNAILCPTQAGFRAGHSTTTAATVVMSDMENAFDNKLYCAAWLSWVLTILPSNGTSMAESNA